MIIRNAFTLVELLVVIAIMMILATVVSSNYFDSRVKSQIAVVKKELADLAHALEVYHVDQNSYPFTYPIQGFDEDIFYEENVRSAFDPKQMDALHRQMLNSAIPPEFGGKPHWDNPNYKAAMEKYAVPSGRMEERWTLRGLIEPMEYYSSLPLDPFSRSGRDTFRYYSNKSFGILYFRAYKPNEYYLLSAGPDRTESNGGYFSVYGLSDEEKDILRDLIRDDQLRQMKILLHHYDPTNGVDSDGDIVQTNS